MITKHIQDHKNVGIDDVWNEPEILEVLYLAKLQKAHGLQEGLKLFHEIWDETIAEWHTTYDNGGTTVSWEDEQALSLLEHALSALPHAPERLAPITNADDFCFIDIDLDFGTPDVLPVVSDAESAKTAEESPASLSSIRRSIGSACFESLAPGGSPHIQETFDLTQNIHPFYNLSFAFVIGFLVRHNPKNVINERSARRMGLPELVATLLDEASELLSFSDKRFELQAETIKYILSLDETSAFDRKKTSLELLGINKIAQALKPTTRSPSPDFQKKIDRIEAEHQHRYGSSSPIRSTPFPTPKPLRSSPLDTIHEEQAAPSDCSDEE